MQKFREKQAMIPSHEERVGRYIQDRERGVIDEMMRYYSNQMPERKRRNQTKVLGVEILSLKGEDIPPNNVYNILPQSSGDFDPEAHLELKTSLDPS